MQAMFLSAFHTVANRWKQPNVHRRVNNTAKTHTDKYSASKRNKILIYTAVWMLTVKEAKHGEVKCMILLL